MAKFKQQKTLADYVGIAISPLLIMVLVGSLAFFLLEVIRVSPHLGMLRWTMFWYVIAIVLITRIGIEQGNSPAMGYGLAIAMVTSLVIFKYASSHFFGCVIIMGLIWWCAHKLTWDCTLIDDSDDASGEGLLQVAGIEQNEQSSEAHSFEEKPRPEQKESTESDAAGLSLEEQLRADRERRESLWNEDVRTKKKTKPHAPGLWIIYFSLAALPLFGLGQLMIDAKETARRAIAFRYLWFYVAAALALLLTTSFLGLRRYLRQRNMAMPSIVVKNWLGMGGVMILVIMLVALLLPRPNAAYSLTKLIDDLGEKVQKASDHAFLKDDAGKSDKPKKGKGQGNQPRKQNSENKKSRGGKIQKSKDGKNQGKQKSRQQKGNQKNKNRQQKGNQKNRQGKNQKKSQGKPKQGKKSKGGQKKNQNQKGENKQQQGKNDQQGKKQRKSTQKENNKQTKKKKTENPGNKGKQNKDNQAQKRRENDENRKKDKDQKDVQKTSEEQQEQKSEQPKSKSWNFNFASWIGDIFKWILYAIIASVLLYYLIKNWDRVVAFFRQLWQELMNLFHRNPPEKELEHEEETVFVAAPPPFASFHDPFLTGAAIGMHPSQLVIYTFDALESWAYENADARQKDETPLEFAERLETRSSSPVWHKFARLYTRTVYSEKRPNEQCYGLLRNVWQEMSARQTTNSQPMGV